MRSSLMMRQGSVSHLVTAVMVSMRAFRAACAPLPLRLLKVYGEDLLGLRDGHLADLVVHDAARELRGHDLPPPGDGSEEGIVVTDAQRLVLPGPDLLDEVRDPPHLVGHGVTTVALVAPRVEVCPHEGGKELLVVHALRALTPW